MRETDQSQEENWRIACAEELGWKSMETPMGMVHWPPGLHPMQNICGHTLPDPLHSIADAFALVEAVRKDGWDCRLYLNSAGISCTFGRDIQTISVYDPDICRAITLAFLKFKGRV